MAKDRYLYGVTFLGDRVSKFIGANCREEFERSTAIWEAFRGTSTLVPKPLQLDEESRAIEYSRIENDGLLQEELERAYAVQDWTRAETANRAAAQALAWFHAHVDATCQAPWSPPHGLGLREDIGQDQPIVPLHGDYSPVNVMLVPDDGIAIIDAIPNLYFVPARTTHGPRLVDIANYIAKLKWPYRLRSYSPRWGRAASRLRSEFIATYSAAAAVEVDLDQLSRLEQSVKYGYAAHKSPSRLVRFGASAVCAVASRIF